MLDTSNLLSCPKCSQEFQPKRSNQKYCSRTCQKVTSNNTSRGSRKVENKERSAFHYERAKRLEEMVYSVAPAERLGVMMHILGFVPNDAGLRNILFDPKLLKERPHPSGRMNIAKAANRYTKKFYGSPSRPTSERLMQVRVSLPSS